MRCEGIGTQGRYPYVDGLPCGEFTKDECAYCGTGVCIRCQLACYQCALPLHDFCRADHAEESGHQVDFPSARFEAVMNTYVDRVMGIVEKAS